MRARSNIIALTVLTGTLLLSSCGSSDSGRTSDTTGTTITKADFVEQANAMCTSVSETLSNAHAALGSSPTEAQMSVFMTDVLVAEIRVTFGDIRDLGFPAGDESLLDGILDDAEKVLDEIANDPIATLSLAENPFADVNAGFQDYGLTVCAEL